MKRILLCILTAIWSFTIPAAADSSPKYEMRGAWIVTAYGIDWPAERGASPAVARRQKSQLDSMLLRLQQAGINTVFFQVRPMADALYESTLEPWSSFLTGSRGTRPTYDPLAHCIEECHRLGMECHAWVNPFRVGTKRPATVMDRQKSHMWMTSKVKRTTMTIFNPALEETRNHLCAVCSEIATNYDIDGIVFDDYFYNPEFMPEDESAADWDLYVQSSDGLSMADWRRRNINMAIADVHDLLDGIKDGKIRFGVSPQGIAGGNGVHAESGVPDLAEYGVMTADSQYAKIYSDPISWLRDGLIDYISPQIYWTTDTPRHPYDALCRWWNDVAEMFGRHCFASQNIVPFNEDNSIRSWNERIRQVRINRSSAFNNAPGSIFYSASYISGPKQEGFGVALRDSVFTAPALVPPMTWKASGPPLDMSGLKIEGNELTWDILGDSRYVVYAIPDNIDPIEALSTNSDGFKSDYIIGLTYTNRFRIPGRYRSGYRIAVAPYDRYGIEWNARFINE